MFCPKCGTQLNDGARFCPSCGAGIGAGEPAENAAPVRPEAGTTSTRPPILGGKKRRGLGLVLVAAALCVAVGVGAVAAIGGAFGSPKGKVTKAMGKTIQAYSSALEVFETPELDKLVKENKFSTAMSLKVDQVPGIFGAELSLLKGMGLRYEVNSDVPGRALDASTALFYGSADLAALQMSLKDDQVILYSPDFLDDTALGLDTRTLGRDLHGLGVDPYGFDIEKVSFNLFDLIETFSKTPELDPAARKEFVKAIQVDKQGPADIEVNGRGVKCTKYQVVIPKDAMKDWLKAAEDAYKALNYEDAILDMLRSFGVSEAELDEVKGELGTDASVSELFDGLKEVVKKVGDLELEVYVDGGYVMAVLWEDKIEGSRVEVGLYLGGSGNYTDDLSLEVAVDEERIRLESSGNHSGKGPFTDSSRLTFKTGGETQFTLKSELEFDPRKEGDNFTWSMKCDEFRVNAEGSLTVKKDSVDLQLEELSFSAYGEKVALEMGYTCRPYSAGEAIDAKPLMLSEASLDDLEDLAGEIEDNAGDWVEKVMKRVPELEDLFYSLYWYF